MPGRGDSSGYHLARRCSAPARLLFWLAALGCLFTACANVGRLCAAPANPGQDPGSRGGINVRTEATRVKTGVAQKELNMTIKRVTAISTLLLGAAICCFGQAAPAAPVVPVTPVEAAAPLTILTMAGSFYDGGSHHAAIRVGGFIPLSDATSTAKSNWIGLVADMGFGSNTPTTPKYALGGRFLQKVGTLHFETYAGTAQGPLTDRENPPFMRRADLQDPTAFLDGCQDVATPPATI